MARLADLMGSGSVMNSLTSAKGDSKKEEGRHLGEYKAPSFDDDLHTFNVFLTIFLALLTLLDCRMYLRRGWLPKLEVVCITFLMAVCLQRFVRIKRTLSVMRKGSVGV